MARQKKPSGSKQLKTGDDFIEAARSAGANIEPSKIEGFTKVSTRAGATYITPGKHPLDPRTRKNLRHWFRLLRLLMLIILITLPIWIQHVKNFLWHAGIIS